MKIQEADAKGLLLAQGLPVPAWSVARTSGEARAVARPLLKGVSAAKVCVNKPQERRRLVELEYTDESLSVILCARHNRREGAYDAEQSEESNA